MTAHQLHVTEHFDMYSWTLCMYLFSFQDTYIKNDLATDKHVVEKGVRECVPILFAPD